MGTPSEPYQRYIEQSQAAFAEAIDTWSKAAERTVSALPGGTPPVDPEQLVDSVFDVATQMLQMQRELAKNLLAGSAALSRRVTEDVTGDHPAGSEA